MRTGYAIGRDKSVYRPETEQWNMILFLVIAILLFVGGFLMQAFSLAHIRTTALFHEWGHIFGAYSSGGWGYLSDWNTTGYFGGNSNWIKVWGPLGGVVFPVVLWMLFLKLNIPVFGAVFFGMAHGEILFNEHLGYVEIYVSAWAPAFYYIGVTVALVLGWVVLYRHAVKLGGKYGFRIRQKKAVRRNTAVSPGKGRWRGQAVG